MVLLPNTPDQIKLGSLIIAVSAFLSLIQWKRLRENWQFISTASVLLVLWFALKLVGLLPAQDFQMAIRAVFLKLPFLLFPLIFLSWQPTKADVTHLLRAFVLACLFAGFLSFGLAAFKYLNEGDTSYFSYAKLSPFLHPAYLAMYINFAFSLCIIRLRHLNYRSSAIFFLLAFFALFILLLLSRNGILFLGINITVLAFLLVRARRWSSFLGLFAMLLLLSTMVLQNEKARVRIKAAIGYFDLNEKQASADSFGVRLLVWKSSLQLIAAHPFFGVGSGFEREELAKVYDQEGVTKAKERYYNTHNQFLQTSLAHGLVGFLLVVLVFVLPLFRLRGESLFVFALFVALCFVSFFTESMLERQAGVFFFALFYTLVGKDYD